MILDSSGFQLSHSDYSSLFEKSWRTRYNNFIRLFSRMRSVLIFVSISLLSVRLSPWMLHESVMLLFYF